MRPRSARPIGVRTAAPRRKQTSKTRSSASTCAAGNQAGSTMAHGRTTATTACMALSSSTTARDSGATMSTPPTHALTTHAPNFFIGGLSCWRDQGAEKYDTMLRDTDYHIRPRDVLALTPDRARRAAGDDCPPCISNANTHFQSSFMLTIVQPRAL